MFTKFVEYSNNLFDLLAFSYTQINSIYSPAKLSTYDCNKQVNDIHEAFGEYIEELSYDHHSAFNHLKINLLSIYNLDHDEFVFYFTIIMSIDTIPYEYIDQYLDREVKRIGRLNSCQDDVYVFPKMGATLINTYNSHISRGLRKRKEYKPGCLNSKLNNYIVLLLSELSGYIPNMYYLTDGNTMLKNYQKNTTLKIAVVPFLNESLRNLLIIKNDDKTFWIEGVIPEKKELIIKRFQVLLTSLLNEDIDIVIFPEMLLIRDALPEIEDLLSDLYKHNFNKSIILICGSIWENNENKCYLYHNSGSLLFIQHKQTPFTLEDKYDERLSYIDKSVNFIDINGLGRFFFLICRDIDNTDLVNIAKKLRADFILLPSFSRSLDLDTSARNLAEQNHCITIMSNSCSAFNYNDKNRTLDDCIKLGFISYPSKCDGDRSSKTEYYNSLGNCINCMDKICYKVFHLNPTIIQQYNKEFYLKCDII